MRIDDPTEILLEGDDVALVIRNDGSIEAYLSAAEEAVNDLEDDEEGPDATPGEIALLHCIEFLEDFLSPKDPEEYDA